jgi:hypothetical protein
MAMAGAVVSLGRSAGECSRDPTLKTTMTIEFTPEFLGRAAEQLGWDDTPTGQQKRLEDLVLLQELMAIHRWPELCRDQYAFLP